MSSSSNCGASQATEACDDKIVYMAREITEATVCADEARTLSTFFTEADEFHAGFMEEFGAVSPRFRYRALQKLAPVQFSCKRPLRANDQSPSGTSIACCRTSHPQTRTAPPRAEGSSVPSAYTASPPPLGTLIPAAVPSMSRIVPDSFCQCSFSACTSTMNGTRPSISMSLPSPDSVQTAACEPH